MQNRYIAFDSNWVDNRTREIQAELNLRKEQEMSEYEEELSVVLSSKLLTFRDTRVRCEYNTKNRYDMYTADEFQNSQEITDENRSIDCALSGTPGWETSYIDN